MPDNKQSARRLTRCRTGCMRCRVRRRKCDEGKPRCRNCIDRDFTCRYGPQLTFLTKNAQTVQASEVETPSTGYETIRFVNEDPQTEDYEVNALGGASSPAADEPTVPEHALQQSATSPHPEGDAPNDEPSTWLYDGPPESTPRVFSDNDECAVAGLLALGTSRVDIMEPDLSMPDLMISPLARDFQLDRGVPSSKPSDSANLFSTDTIPFLRHLDPNRSAIEILELLRHYRYNVAPWLDICDLGQSFGIKGLQLAMASEPAWDLLLAVSMASMNKPPTHTVTQGPLVREHQSDITTAAFLQALNATRTCILDTHGAWSSQRGVDTELFEALSSYVVGRDFNSAIYWLFVRLDLGAALATDTNLQIPLPPLPPNVADADTKTDTFASSFCYANRPLWACARAIEFMHNEDASPQCPPLHTWMQLVEELENWYQERPQGFQPMLELDVENNLEMAQGFPVVLFANGAGVFSNQLYHTAMLLLLHSRPRTARIASLRSATMSPLWHAQRICSIALNNERRECWDPCLLASFITAAQRMTHETQQQEILLGLSRIRKVTGWNVDGLLHGLKESWGFLES